MSNMLWNPGPIDDFITKILNDPLLLIAFLILIVCFGALVIGGYKLLFSSTERKLVLDQTYQYLDQLEKMKKYDRFRHGQETAQQHIDKWRELNRNKKNLTGHEGLLRIKKWNLEAETYLKLQGDIPKDEEE